MKLIAFSLIALALLAGCTQNVKPQTPRESLALAEGTYNAAVAVAIQYKALPPCGGGVTKVCSDPAMLAKLKAADKLVQESFDAAEKTINDPNFSKDAMSAALVAVDNALVLLTAITSQLQLK